MLGVKAGGLLPVDNFVTVSPCRYAAASSRLYISRPGRLFALRGSPSFFLPASLTLTSPAFLDVVHFLDQKPEFFRLHSLDLFLEIISFACSTLPILFAIKMRPSVVYGVLSAAARSALGQAVGGCYDACLARSVHATDCVDIQCVCTNMTELQVSHDCALFP